MPEQDASRNCISEASFDFDNLKVPASRVRKFFIVHEGCSESVAANSMLTTDTSVGEAHMDRVMGGADTDNAKKYLRQDCVVYAVAV